MTSKSIKSAIETIVNPWLHGYGLKIEILTVRDKEIHLKLVGELDGYAVSEKVVKENIQWVLDTKFPNKFHRILIVKE